MEQAALREDTWLNSSSSDKILELRWEWGTRKRME